MGLELKEAGQGTCTGSAVKHHWFTNHPAKEAPADQTSFRCTAPQSWSTLSTLYPVIRRLRWSLLNSLYSFTCRFLSSDNWNAPPYWAAPFATYLIVRYYYPRIIISDVVAGLVDWMNLGVRARVRGLVLRPCSTHAVTTIITTIVTTIITTLITTSDMQIDDIYIETDPPVPIKHLRIIYFILTFW